MSRSCTPAHVRSATLRTQMHYADAHYALGKCPKNPAEFSAADDDASSFVTGSFIMYSKAASCTYSDAELARSRPAGGASVLMSPGVSRANRSVY